MTACDPGMAVEVFEELLAQTVGFWLVAPDCLLTSVDKTWGRKVSADFQRIQILPGHGGPERGNGRAPHQFPRR